MVDTPHGLHAVVHGLLNPADVTCPCRVTVTVRADHPHDAAGVAGQLQLIA